MQGYEIQLTQIKMHIPTQQWSMDLFIAGNAHTTTLKEGEANNIIDTIQFKNMQVSNDKDYIYYMPIPKTRKA